MLISLCSKKADIPYELLLEADPNKQLVENYLQNGEVFLAIKNNKTIGIYVLMMTGPEQAEIMNISVAVDWRNQGVGKQLLTHAIEQAKQRKVRFLHICTGNSSINQLALYQKTGFRITSIEKNFFTNNYPQEIIENGIICRDKIRLVFAL